MENIKIGGSLARNARFFAPTCLVSSLWFSCGVAVSMGEVAKSLLCQGFKFGMYWTVGSVRLAVCKDMTRVGSCCRWKVVVWTHTYFTKCRLYIGLVLRRQTLCRLYIYISLFWFCVGKHFGCAQLQENVKHSQFMTQGVDRDIARR